ncbi:MAG: prepilin peptidase [Elusimicrobiota bacterium]
MISAYQYTLIFITGLVLGSFANVCIYRLPREESIILPGSRCPQCKHKIPWYLNIPLVSYIILKGKCKYCRESISFRYPAVEFITAVLTTLWWVKFSPGFTAFLFSVFGVFLIVISGVDIDFKVIPPQCSYGLMITGLASAPFNSFLDAGLGSSFLGLAVAGILLMAVRKFGSYIFKKEALGLGDIKLLMGIGAFTGTGGVLGTLFIGSLLGSILGLIFRFAGKIKKLEYIPFGPYLAGGSVIYIFFREFFINLFFNAPYLP